MVRWLTALLVILVYLALHIGPVHAVPADVSIGDALQVGASGPAVFYLQQQLRRAGYDPGPADGKFGPLTAAALRSAQTAAGLPATGTVDDRTRSELATMARVYRVQPGDTLAGIAARLGLDTGLVASETGLPDPDLIVPGQMLRLPSLSEPEEAAPENAGHVPPSAVEAVEPGDEDEMVVYLPGAPVAATAPLVAANPTLPPIAADTTPPPPAHLPAPPGLGQTGFAGPVLSVPLAGNQRRAALTLNLAPAADGSEVDELLAVLASHGARATLFLPPHLLDQRPELAAAIVQAGHRIGYLADTVPPTGRAGISLIRPASGRWQPDLPDQARAAGLRVAMWSSIGLRPRPGMDAETVTTQALRSLFPGAVLMLPAHLPEARTALPNLLRAATFTAGYQLVPVEELLEPRSV